MPPKAKKVCNARDCDEQFVPRVPRQAYHTDECREREAAARAEEQKAERALQKANDQTHRQFFPSTFFNGSRLMAVITDIRFEMEQDRAARSGNREVIAARVKGLGEALRADDQEGIYGACISLAAACGALAMRTNGGARFQRRRRGDAA